MPDFRLERRLGGVVAGVDEVGRGPWAGPVVAAAVILRPDAIPDGLDDSKKLTRRKREMLFEEICGASTVAFDDAVGGLFAVRSEIAVY